MFCQVSKPSPLKNASWIIAVLSSTQRLQICVK